MLMVVGMGMGVGLVLSALVQACSASAHRGASSNE